MKLGPEQSVQMPMKTVISLIIMVALGTFGFFQIQEKLNQHATKIEIMESCPKCGKYYDEIDFDFQACSKCGWDSNLNKYSSDIIEVPTEKDYMNGDADILTGEWY